MLGKNGIHIRIQQEKSYQNDKLFYLGFGKVLKMQASVIEMFAEPTSPGSLQVKQYTTFRHNRRSIDKSTHKNSII